MTGRRAKGNLFSLIIGVVVLLGLVFGGVFVYRFTNGFNEDLKTFYIVVNGEKVLSSAKGYSVDRKKGMDVKVKYTFGKPDDADNLYSVKVTSNYDKEKNFEFTVDDFTYTFGNGDDYTEGFDIEYGEDGFVIKTKGYLNEIMSAVFPDREISDCNNKEFDDMFILTVYSYNGKSFVKVYFTVFNYVKGVSLDKGEIRI